MKVVVDHVAVLEGFWDVVLVAVLGDLAVGGLVVDLLLVLDADEDVVLELLGLLVVGHELEGLLGVGECLLVLLALHVGVGAAEEGLEVALARLGEALLEALGVVDDLGAVVDGLLELVELDVGQGAVEPER